MRHQLPFPALAGALLLLGAPAFAQLAGRLESVIGVAPNYDPKPASDALLNGPWRLLSAGPNGFYFFEPGNRLMRVDTQGQLTVFGAASATNGLADADDSGNFYYSIGTGIGRISADGKTSIPFDWLNDASLSALGYPVSIASNRRDGSVYLSNGTGLFVLPGGVSLNLADTRYATRMYAGFAETGLVWISGAGSLKVYSSIEGLVAGSGSYGVPTDGQRALEAPFQTLTDVVADTAGRVYVADRSIGSVYRIANGILERVAGLSDGPDAAPGAKAKDVRFLRIDSIALDSNGRLLIADAQAFTIWRVEDDGALSRAAGRPRGGSEPGGGVALSDPSGLAYDRNHNLYVVDRLNFRIRALNADGSVETVAGNGSRARKTVDGAAVKVAINPDGPIVVDPSGWVYFLDGGGYSVRRFRPGGSIETWITQNDLDKYSGLSMLALGMSSQGDLLVAQRTRLLAITPQKTVSLRADPARAGSAVGDAATFTVLGDDSVVFSGRSGSAAYFIRFNRAGEPEFLPVDTPSAPSPCTAPFRAMAPSQRGLVAANPGMLCEYDLEGGGRLLAGSGQAGGAPVVGALGSIKAIATSPSGAVAFSESDTHQVRRFTPALRKGTRR